MQKMMCCMCGCKNHAGIFLSSFYPHDRVRSLVL